MSKINRKVKDKDYTKFIADMEAELGVTLVAKKADDTVNGHISFSGEDAEITLYEYDKDPDFELYQRHGVTYSRGSKITIRKADITPKKDK